MNVITENKITVIRKAIEADNEALLELTSQTHMEGNIALRIDRHPDFFSLLKQRGESVTLVCEYGGKVIGCVSVTASWVYINGRIRKIHYLSDLKIENRYQGKRLALHLNQELKMYLLSIDADILFMVIAHGNYKMKPYTEGIGNLPEFQPTGFFKIMQFLPTKRLADPGEYDLDILSPGDEEINRLNNFYVRYQFGKVLPLTPGSSSLYVGLKKGDELLAMISLIDMTPHKQNVVVNAKGWLKGLMTVAEWTNSLNLPKRGEPIRIYYINNFYYKAGYGHLINILIDWARNYCSKSNGHFVSLGLHERDPLLRVLKSRMRITFFSKGYVTSLKGNLEILKQITGGVAFEDYSLV